MKTRQHDPSGTPGLPPAPAPPSRDANPWPMSAQGKAAPTLHPRVRGAVRNAAGRQKLSWLPYLVLVFIAATSLRVAIGAFEAGRLEAAVGPMIAIVFVAFVAWRRIRRKR